MNNVYKYTVVTFVLITVIVFWVCFITSPDTPDYKIISEQEMTDIREIVKSFIILDSSFVDSKGLENLDKMKRYVSEEYFHDEYLATVRFTGLPEELEHPTLTFKHFGYDLTNSGYNVIVVADYNYSDGTYPYTIIVYLNNDKVITQHITHPHLGYRYN